MPTLSSIAVHQLIRDKLSLLEPPIETPQALLSRDPSNLAQSMAVPIDELLRLRKDVADAVIANGENGKRALRIHGSLGGLGNKYELSNDPMDSNEQAEVREANHNSAFIPGSVTARELCCFESLGGVGQHSLSTGSHQLDQLLGFPQEYSRFSLLHAERNSSVGDYIESGGIPFGYVTQVTGPPASGKTQMALAAAARHATKYVGTSVFYLGSGALLPLAFRLKYICKETCKDDSLINQVCQGVTFTMVSNAHDVLTSLSEIESSCLESAMDGDVSTRTPILIILDSVSGCLSERLYSSGDRGASISLVRQVADELKRISRQYDAAVLVTNSTVSSKDGNSFKPAMGQYWRVADVNLWFETLSDDAWAGQEKVPSLEISSQRTIRANLENHPTKRCHDNTKNLTATFAITANGIEDTELQQPPMSDLA